MIGGFARPSSNSPWATLVISITIKDTNLILCFEYKRLNSITKDDKYLLSRIDDALNQLQGATVLSSVDQQHEEACKKTSFTCTKRLFKYSTMPFGLCDGTNTFQRLVDIVVSKLRWQWINIYYGKKSSLMQDLYCIFQCLIDMGLKMQHCMDELTYLAHVYVGFNVTRSR